MQRNHDLLTGRDRDLSQPDGAAVLAALLRGIALAFGFAAVTMMCLLPMILLYGQDIALWPLIVAMLQLTLLLVTVIRLLMSLAALAPGPKGSLPIENRWSVFPNNVDHAAFAALVGIALGFLR